MITSINDIRILESRVQNTGSYNACNFFFRGHENQSYPLKPTISRKLNDINQIQIAESFIEEKVTEFFKSEKITKETQALPEPKGYLSIWRTLFQTQNCEIPTRLLDVTISIYHAVYFAVMNPEFDSFDGELIIFYCPSNKVYTDVSENNSHFIGDIDPYDVQSEIFVNGGLFVDEILSDDLPEVRRYKQFGKFFIQPTKSLLQPFTSNGIIIFRTELIQKEHKEIIRKELSDIGINFENVLIRKPNSTLLIKKEIESYIENLITT